MKCRTLFFAAMCLVLASQSDAFLHEEKGSFKLHCGSLHGKVEYRTVIDTRILFENKFAILIDGSPLSEYFSHKSGNYEVIFWSLLANGYKVLEFKYPHSLSATSDARGFYAACLHQGLEAVIRHDGELYEALVEQLGFDFQNGQHQLVAFGFSIGAMKLQSMAFTLGKSFDKVGLAGVLLGDVETGSKADSANSDGMSWTYFLQLAEHISADGLGCRGIEFSSKYNFENQPHFANSNLAMFEGTKICATEPFEAAANPGQVKYIARKRLEQKAPTQVFEYENCGHDVIKCGGEQVVHDVVDFLTSGGKTVNVARYLKGH